MKVAFARGMLRHAIALALAGCSTAPTSPPGLASIPSLACPSSPPSDGTACSQTGATRPGVNTICEYGPSADPNCNEVFECAPATPTASVETWVDISTGACAPRTACPTSFASVPVNGPCPAPVLCAYSEGACGCVSGGSGLWSCAPLGDGCPNPRPDIGTPCSIPQQTCNYGDACNGGVTLFCWDSTDDGFTGSFWIVAASCSDGA